jgi:hypothetical protein
VIARSTARFITLVALLLALVVAVTPALADKGGNHATSSSATVSANPNPATAGSRVYLSGCGYTFQPVYVTVTGSDGSSQSFYVGMWSNGCLDNAYFIAGATGTYTIQVWQANSPKLDLMATASLNVT